MPVDQRIIQAFSGGCGPLALDLHSHTSLLLRAVWDLRAGSDGCTLRMPRHSQLDYIDATPSLPRGAIPFRVPSFQD